jgi:HEAT repeat protein
MLSIADPLTASAIMILVSVLMGTLLLVAVAIIRRWQQIHYSLHLQALHIRYRPILDQLLSGTRTVEGMAALRQLPMSDLELLVEPLLAQQKCTDQKFGFLVALCTELGLVELWRRRLAAGNNRMGPPALLHRFAKVAKPSPQRWLLRAKSIRNLGLLRHHPSWPLLLKALDDPHCDIQTVALRALASIRASGSFPVLLERLQAVVLGQTSNPPLRPLEAALASFDLTFCPDLLPALRHPHPRIRSLAMDLLRLFVRREATRDPEFRLTAEILSPEIACLLLTDLYRDEVGEVRGHAAEVIAFLTYPRAATILHGLCSDSLWQVRQRTVRALAHQRDPNPILLLAVRDCLSDPHWRVREAAMQTLIAFGPSGRQQLYESFLTCDNPTIRQQIVEVIERRGLMGSLIEAYGHGVSGVEALLVEQIASGAAPLGLPAFLRAAAPPMLARFSERFLHYSQLKMKLQGGAPTEQGARGDRQKDLEFPPAFAA